MALKYTGDPKNDYIPGVPARDLTTEEEKQYPEAAVASFYKKANRRAATEEN